MRKLRDVPEESSSSRNRRGTRAWIMRCYSVSQAHGGFEVQSPEFLI